MKGYLRTGRPVRSRRCPVTRNGLSQELTNTSAGSSVMFIYLAGANCSRVIETIHRPQPDYGQNSKSGGTQTLFPEGTYTYA